MIVGLPGTGIGGVFYLLSAFAMPLREAYRWASGRSPAAAWRVVVGLVTIGAGILAGVWATGWLLGLVLGTGHAAVAGWKPPGGAHAENVVRVAMLLVSVAVLALVLIGIELLAWWSRRGRGPEPSVSERDAPRLGRKRSPATRRVAGEKWHAAILLALVGTAVAATAAAQHDGGEGAARHLARAESAFVAGDPALAAVEYAAVLVSDSENSRATFRLAQLRLRADRAAASRLFRRYVALEPSDPWGYVAVGDVEAQARRYTEALRWYDEALRLAPQERDAVVGQARVLVGAGRTEAAIAAYGRWLAATPGDAEALRELARECRRAGRFRDEVRALERAQGLAPDSATARRLVVARRAAAAAFTPLVSGGRDSDGNGTIRVGGAVDFATGGPTRLGVTVSRGRVGTGVASASLVDAGLQMEWRPRAALRIDAGAGATHLDGAGAGSTGAIPVGRLRIRWHRSTGGVAAELRARRSALDATSLLVSNRVVRSELGTRVDLPVARGPRSLKLRGIGRVAALTGAAQRNQRTTAGGAVVIPAAPGVEVSAQFQELRYAHTSTAGYFAPRLVQTVEVGSYMELETPGSAVFAFDVGVGVQRLALHGARPGAWRGAVHVYSYITLPLAPGRELRLEADGEASSIAPEAATSAQWRYGSAALSIRWAFP